MATQTIQSVNQPLVSILRNGTTLSIPSTTENNDVPTPSTHGPVHNGTPRPLRRITVVDQPPPAAGQDSLRPRQRRRGSSPPPPSPPHNTPTVRFGAEPQGPSVQRGRRALQRLSHNGALRPAPRTRRRQRANSATALELGNAGIVATNNNAANVQDNDARRAAAELERTMFNDPYVWSRASYPANLVVYNDRLQHTEEPGWPFGA